MKQLCDNDTFPQKVDLVIGAYRGEDAKPWILPVVRKACHEIDDQDAPIVPYF
jgi:aspartate aminotransferase